MGIRWHMTRRKASLTRLFCALAVVMSGALFTAAALVPAPPAVLPLLLAVCIGGPMLAAWELRSTTGVATRRRTRDKLDSNAVAQLRSQLEALPETQHPLGL
jgi:4-amino-4-deoxy-L-arabinose transferase-like glycosyltransferase